MAEIEGPIRRGINEGHGSLEFGGGNAWMFVLKSNEKGSVGPIERSIGTFLKS